MDPSCYDDYYYFCCCYCLDALGIDLLHCESMTKLDTGTLNRLLEKNY